MALNNVNSTTPKKPREFYHENYFSDEEKIALKLCEEGNFAQALQKMSKQTGVHGYHFQIYVMLKMGRIDLAKQIRDHVLSEYNGYFGSSPYVSVHKLFLESQAENQLKRKLTDTEISEIGKYLDGICAISNTVTNHIVLFGDGVLPKKINDHYDFLKMISILAGKNRIGNSVIINKKPKKLTFTKLLKMVNESPQKPEDSKYLDYVSAKKFVSSLNLESEKQWIEYCATNKKPSDIPNNPLRYYSQDWKSWEDWLGTLSKKYLLFSEAKKFVKSLELENRQDWLAYCKSEKLPENIPSQPQKIYDEWEDWDDWLGTKNRQYLPFLEARKIISELGFDTKKQWTVFCKSGKKQKSIPSKPDEIYQNQWNGWEDWLGVKDRNYLSYNQAKKFLFDYGIESWDQWKEFRDSDKRPKNIPYDPWKVYESEEFHPKFDKFDFFGLYDRDYLSYEDATKLIKKMNFKNFEQYKKWVTSDKRPKNIPLEPLAYYSHNTSSSPGIRSSDYNYWYSWDAYLGLK